ncbi:MAG: LLM class flavin-dependent oxidoreductase [Proteobacteria bacterium]|nr:LLM class flavin-dependent oxidoreductase [Pseudomonadota bacterium]
MQLYHFSEVPYPDVPDINTTDSIRIDLPSSVYDPKKGLINYNERLDEWGLCDELGINIMLNEHHQTPTCTVPSIAIFGGILARETNNVRILQLGNPAGNRRDPIRIAEETAMVDVLSNGRLDCGFVRGVPHEIAPANSNPTTMASRLWESVDLIKKAWTTHDGPFRWEGKNFHYRVVNVWPRPIQQPHPPMWMPTSSTTTAEELARRKMVCATMTTGYDRTREIYDAYRKVYRETHGSEAPTDRFAFLGFGHVADTETEARKGAEALMWYLSHGKTSVQYVTPPGYIPPEAYAAMTAPNANAEKMRAPDVDFQTDFGNLYWGTPDTVVAQINTFNERVGGVGNMLLTGHAGPMTHKDTERYLKMMAAEVYPRLKEIGAPERAAAE